MVESRTAITTTLVIPYRGLLVMPWAPEWGQGGLSLFDVSDPCDPQKVGEGFHERMRESHAVGFMHIPETDDEALSEPLASPGDYAVL